MGSAELIGTNADLMTIGNADILACMHENHNGNTFVLKNTDSMPLSKYKL